MKVLGAVLLSFLVTLTTVFGLVAWQPSFLQTSPAPLAEFTKLIKYSGGSCSGVVIAPTLVLTAAHCAQERMTIDGYNVRILKRDTSRDLMVVYGHDITCPCVQVADKQPAIGTRVFVAGYPLGAGPFFTEGLSAGPVDFEKNAGVKDLQLVSAIVVGGNSGGGMFIRENGRWLLIGTVTGTPVIPFQGMFPQVVSHMAFGPSVHSLNEFLFNRDLAGQINGR